MLEMMTTNPLLQRMAADPEWWAQLQRAALKRGRRADDGDIASDDSDGDGSDGDGSDAMDDDADDGMDDDRDPAADALAIVPAAAEAPLGDEAQLRALLDALPDRALGAVPMEPAGVVHHLVAAMAQRHVHLTGSTKPLQEWCNFDIVNDVAPAVMLTPAADPADVNPKRSYVFMAPCRGNKTVVIIATVTLASKLGRPSIVIVCDQKANIQDVAKRIHDGFVQLTSPDHEALMCDATALEDLTPEQVARVRDGRLVLVMMAHHHTLQALETELSRRLGLEGAVVVFDEADNLWSSDSTSSSSVRRERLVHRILDVERVERPRFLRSVVHISATHMPTIKWHSMTRLKYRVRFADEARMRANQYALDDILRAPVDAEGKPIYLTATATAPRRPPATPRLKKRDDETEAAYQERQQASHDRSMAAYRAKVEEYDAEMARDRGLMDDFIRKFALARERGRMLMMATTQFIMEGRDVNAMSAVKRAIQVAATEFGKQPSTSSGAPPFNVPVGLVIHGGRSGRGGCGRIFEWGDRPGAGVDGFTEREMSTADALKWLLTVPLDTPVIVSGYGCIRRCINLAAQVPDHPERSRVITHMILTPTKGTNVSDVYQLFNRGGGLTQEARVLHMGHPNVEVLTREADLDLVRGLPELTRRLLEASQDDVDAWMSDPDAHAVLTTQEVAERVLGAIMTARPQAKARLGTVLNRDLGPLRVQMKRVADARKDAPRGRMQTMLLWHRVLVVARQNFGSVEFDGKTLAEHIDIHGQHRRTLSYLVEKKMFERTGKNVYRLTADGLSESSRLMGGAAA